MLFLLLLARAPSACSTKAGSDGSGRGEEGEGWKMGFWQSCGDAVKECFWWFGYMAGIVGNKGSRLTVFEVGVG